MAAGEAGEPHVLEEVSSGEEEVVEEEGDEVDVEEVVGELERLRGTRCLRRAWWIEPPRVPHSGGSQTGVLLSSGFLVSLGLTGCPRTPSPSRA